MTIARAHLRRRQPEAQRERAEQPIAQRHQSVEIALDRCAKAWKLRPLIDPVQRLSRLDVGIVGGQPGADIEALLQVRQIAGIDRLMQRRVAAVVAVDADLQSLLHRQPEEGRSRRERALDRVPRNAMIDQLEGTPAPERSLEIVRHRFVGAGVAADDRGEAHDRNAHVVIFLSIRRNEASHMR